jgi:hypothetical protein
MTVTVLQSSICPAGVELSCPTRHDDDLVRLLARLHRIDPELEYDIEEYFGDDYTAEDLCRLPTIEDLVDACV